MISYVPEIYDINLADFKAWAGGKERLDIIKELPNCLSEAEDSINLFEMTEGRPMTAEEINDYLWFSLEDDLESTGYYNPEDDKFYNKPYEWVED